jgi:drug/metabolite transporter (DMT)-like permease
MGILLGVLTAISWGSSDFVARFSTRRIGTLRTTLYMQSCGFLLLTVFLYALHAWGHLFDGSGWQPWGWGFVGGTLNVLATLALYRSFEIGKMSVVAPVSASYPVLTTILSVFSGERLTSARVVGIGLTIAGVMLVAGGEKMPKESGAEPGQQSGRGIGWALGAALGFGVMMWLLGVRVVDRTGPYAAVWFIRGVGVLVTSGVLLFKRMPPRQVSGATGWQVAGMGVLDTAAFLMNNRGMQLEQVSVVSVLASLYGAVTVALAAAILREHVSKWQWAGIVAIFSGIYLISK